MKIKLTFLCVIFLSCHASGDKEVLLYLYEPTLSPQQEKVFDQVISQANNGDLVKATILSQELIETLQNEKEQNRKVYGQLMINHGIIRSSALDYEQGFLSINEGLGYLEHHRNPFSPLLLRGIMAKAITELSLDRLENAEDTFRRAQHIWHRDQGVYDSAQLPVISWITKTNLKRGDVLSADREQRFSLRVAEQTFGPKSAEMIPFLNNLGAYFATRGSTIPHLMQTNVRLQRDLLFRQSVNLYQRAISIIEENFGQDDIRLVRPLRGLANARILQVNNRKYAEAALMRSLAIIDSHPGADLTDRTQAMVDLADLYTITVNEKASSLYLEAWQLLQENEQTQDLAKQMFRSPQRLFPREAGILYLDRRPDAAEEGEELFVKIEYTVTDQGKVSQVEVLEKNVPNDQVRLLRYRLRNAKFRPRIEEGEIVATETLTFYQPYEVLKRTNDSTLNQIDEELVAPESAPKKQMMF